jgi:hypothetical protein
MLESTVGTDVDSRLDKLESLLSSLTAAERRGLLARGDDAHTMTQSTLAYTDSWTPLKARMLALQQELAGPPASATGSTPMPAGPPPPVGWAPMSAGPPVGEEISPALWPPPPADHAPWPAADWEAEGGWDDVDWHPVRERDVAMLHRLGFDPTEAEHALSV